MFCLPPSSFPLLLGSGGLIKLLHSTLSPNPGTHKIFFPHLSSNARGSLRRILGDRRVQLEYNDRYSRRLERIIGECNEEIRMYKYKTTMLEGELRSKDKLVLIRG